MEREIDPALDAALDAAKEIIDEFMLYPNDNELDFLIATIERAIKDVAWQAVFKDRTERDLMRWPRTLVPSEN
jgi:hypothetical protein